MKSILSISNAPRILGITFMLGLLFVGLGFSQNSKGLNPGPILSSPMVMMPVEVTGSEGEAGPSLGTAGSLFSISPVVPELVLAAISTGQGVITAMSEDPTELKEVGLEEGLLAAGIQTEDLNVAMIEDGMGTMLDEELASLSSYEEEIKLETLAREIQKTDVSPA